MGDRHLGPCLRAAPGKVTGLGPELAWGQESEIIPGFQQLRGQRESQVAGGTVPKPEGSRQGLGARRWGAGLSALPHGHAPWRGPGRVLQGLREEAQDEGTNYPGRRKNPSC